MPATFEVPPEPRPFRELFERYSRLHNVSPNLLEALALTESAMDPGAVNPADPSYGLGQVLCRSQRRDELCENRLPAIQEFRSMTPNKLLDPDTNVRIYSQIIAENIRRYPGDLDRAIVAYNNFSSAEAGRGSDGRFKRTSPAGLDPEEYLARVVANLERVRSKPATGIRV